MLLGLDLVPDMLRTNYSTITKHSHTPETPEGSADIYIYSKCFAPPAALLRAPILKNDVSSGVSMPSRERRQETVAGQRGLQGSCKGTLGGHKGPQGGHKGAARGHKGATRGHKGATRGHKGPCGLFEEEGI